MVLESEQNSDLIIWSAWLLQPSVPHLQYPWAGTSSHVTSTMLLFINSSIHQSLAEWYFICLGGLDTLLIFLWQHLTSFTSSDTGTYKSSTSSEEWNKNIW